MEEFKDSWDWFIKLKNPRDIIKEHWSFLLIEIVLYIFGLLTLKHALRMGGRYKWIWISTILHGITVESLSYFLPDHINNFWHSQSMITFLGRREPLHIFIFYPAFIYLACVAVDRLRLKKWAEPLAVGLVVVIYDVPWDIMGIKLLWWTWHDTDPNIYDRHYWVPWNSYFFHAAFASSFHMIFHGSRKIFCKTEHKYQSGNFIKELFCSVLTGLFSMPLGTIQFIIMYHPLHDILGLHTEVCVLLLLSTYVMVIWSSDRNPSEDARKSPSRGFDELMLQTVIHFILYPVLAIMETPEDIRAIGLHEKTGECNSTSPVYTAFGMVLSKKKYLCTSNYDEGYYDWHCLPGGRPPKDGLTWYTMCGTPFHNKAEIIIVVSAFSVLGLYIMRQVLLCSGRDIGLGRRSTSKDKKKN